MFRTARMRKLSVITLDTFAHPTVSALHDAGIVQISDISESIQQDPELAELLKPSKASPHTGKISSLLMKTTGISELLGDAISEGMSMKDKLMSFVSPEIPVPKEVGEVDTESLIAYAESTLNQVESETQGIEEKLAALDSEESMLESNKSLAEKLSNVDMDLALLSDSEHTSTIVGRISAESVAEFESESGKITDELFYDLVPDDDKEFKIVIIVVANEYRDEVYNLLRKCDFEKFETDGLEGRPNEIVSSAESRLDRKSVV